MYQPINYSSSCYYGVDGDASSDLFGSRPDALLANGAAFLPSSYYYSQPQQQGLLGGPLTPSCIQQQVQVLREKDPAEEQRVVVVPAGRYSAEERQERIDKYRSKRNQRNFQKKITYACRKTLADSRPRVKGRFARNNGADYTDAEADPVQASRNHVHVECDGSMMMMNADVEGVNGKDSVSRGGTSTPEWWPVMQEALATGVDLDNLCDEEMLAAYLGVSSISLYSPSYSPSTSGH